MMKQLTTKTSLFSSAMPRVRGYKHHEKTGATLSYDKKFIDKLLFQMRTEEHRLVQTGNATEEE